MIVVAAEIEDTRGFLESLAIVATELEDTRGLNEDN
jgi:hypothetical protein